ncbi:type VI secretion system protein TssA [Sedimentitalea sp. JM2-8]|uniref:Type VI secretion system protein TssA n=1 Tax=Sedimentitalea xiamensis TaxID=3050037 RepID=A0ABT7FIF0_9RHOB|nr:type VI secretion system protein TssA [Sedimentitalea xiamensis]MDK3074820.1 type VI secretion system protein TssA [Sedimentitalea xiamensis]
MDPQVLLQTKSDDSPSGENMEYEPLFTEMELAAQPVAEQQIGESVTQGHDPDYSDVVEKALAVLEQSHDLRAAVYLADAILHTEGLTGFADATTVIRGVLENYWDSCHPELDEDDDNDPTMRVNAVQGLCGQPGGLAGPSPVYRSLRRAAMTNSRGFGRFSIRDIDVSEGQITLPDGETGPDTATIAAAFKDTDPATLTASLAAVRTAAENVRAIAAVFDEQTPGQGPELDPLLKLLGQMSKRLAEHAGEEGAQEDVEDSGEDAPEEPRAKSAPGTVPGAISSRTDVTNALERIVTYYKQNEPSSPLPILLERAKRLVHADFLTIMRDMAPEGLDNVRLVGGLGRDDDDDDDEDD